MSFLKYYCFEIVELLYLEKYKSKLRQNRSQLFRQKLLLRRVLYQPHIQPIPKNRKQAKHLIYRFAIICRVQKSVELTRGSLKPTNKFML